MSVDCCVFGAWRGQKRVLDFLGLLQTSYVAGNQTQFSWKNHQSSELLSHLSTLDSLLKERFIQPIRDTIHFVFHLLWRGCSSPHCRVQTQGIQRCSLGLFGSRIPPGCPRHSQRQLLVPMGKGRRWDAILSPNWTWLNENCSNQKCESGGGGSVTMVAGLRVLGRTEEEKRKSA